MISPLLVRALIRSVLLSELVVKARGTRIRSGVHFRSNSNRIHTKLRLESLDSAPLLLISQANRASYACCYRYRQ